jgi:hypothetical protein
VYPRHMHECSRGFDCLHSAPWWPPGFSHITDISVIFTGKTLRCLVFLSTIAASCNLASLAIQ